LLTRLVLRAISGPARAVAVAVAIACVVAGTAHAQQPSSVGAEIVSVTAGDYPLARAVVNVEGTTQAVTAQDFSATIDGQPAQVTAADLASSQNIPLDVLFVMDVSGSMQGAPLARAKEAAAAFVGGLAPGDRVSVLAFSDEVRLVQDYTSDRALAIAAINGLAAGGNTALYRATDEAARKAAVSSQSRRVVILLSDGAQDGVPLTITPDAAIASAASGGTPFFAIGEGNGIDRAYLQALADATKGRYLEAPNPSGLSDLYAGIGQLLRSQYLVTFDATNAHDGSTLTLQLTASGQTASTSEAFSLPAGFGPAGVSVSGIAEGDALSAARSITADVGSRANARVKFYVDDTVVAEVTQPPYSYDLDPARLAGGAHKLRVVVSDADGSHSAETSLSFQSALPAKTTSGGGGGLPLLPIAAGIVGLIVLALAVVVLMRVRSMRTQDAESAARMLPWATSVPSIRTPELVGDDAPEPESIGEPLGLLISRAGADLGSEYTVGGKPVSVGSGARCGVRIDDADMAAEEARIWIRNGHLMVHRMTKLTTMVNEGTSGGWMILEPGDTFEVGQHRFEFRLLPAQGRAGSSGDAPNILRDQPTPAKPPVMTPAPPPAPRARPQHPTTFSELMPRNDFGRD
jgi:VWFA-related protein